LEIAPFEKRCFEDLERLLRLYQQGDTAAAAGLVRAVSPMFIRFCLRQSDPPQDIEDQL
jgi:hypothetical protein